MKTVICCINSKYVHMSSAPWCLLSGIKTYCREDVTAKVIESTLNSKNDELAVKIAAENPDLVGFCCYIWNISAVLSVAQKLSQITENTKIVLGGPEVSYCAEKVLCENPFIDYVLSGEGERDFARLCDKLSAGDDISDIESISYRTADGMCIGTPCIMDDEPPSPYTDEYFNALGGRISYLESSRGCPFNCAYCLSGRCGTVRYFDIETTKKNIIALSGSGTKTVKFVDRTFNANISRAKEIFKFIIDGYSHYIPKTVCFHFEIAGDLLDGETVNLLGGAPRGLIQLEIGMQSFNEKTLRSINRKTDTVRLRENIKKLIAPRNIHIHIDLIAGLPYEDMSSFKNSFNIGFSLGADMLQLGFLKLLHGADMRENPQKYPLEYSKEPPYEVISTEWLSADEIKALHNCEDALERLYNSGRFRRTVAYLTDDCKIDPFDLFCELGNYTGNTHGVSLYDYTVLIYNYFCRLPSVDEKRLRDCMVRDLLITNKSARIPELLRVPDKRLKVIKSQLSENGVGKCSAAILYSENRVLCVDYSRCDAISGEFSHNYHSLETFIP